MKRIRVVSGDGLSLGRFHTNLLEFLTSQLTSLSLFSHSRLSKDPSNPSQTTMLSPDLLVLLVPERMKRISLWSQREPKDQKLLKVGCDASLCP